MKSPSSRNLGPSHIVSPVKIVGVYLRREVPRGIDGASGIEGETDVDGGEAEAYQRRHETGRHLHVLSICHRQDDHQENRGAQSLVHHEGHISRGGVGVGGKDAGRVQRRVTFSIQDIVDAVGVGAVEDGGADEGPEVLRSPVDGEDAPLALPKQF